MSRVVFDAFSIGDIVPPEYDPHTFYHRYKNGTGADKLPEYNDVRKRIEPLLRRNPHSADELRRKLGVPMTNLVRILDYLFTHTGEIAALDLPERDTLYIWADAKVAEETRSRLATGGVKIQPESITAEDLPVLSAYLTNLLVLRPSIETLDRTIEKTQRLLDAFRLKQALTKSNENEGQIALLKEKLQQLQQRRDTEWARWNRTDSEEEDETESSHGGGPSGAGDEAVPQAGAESGGDLGQGGGREVYPHATLYLMGSGYHYTGPEREKRKTWRDPDLNRLRFPNLTKIVVEMDTFFEDVSHGMRVHETVERVRATLYAGDQVEVVYRRVPGITYPKSVAKRLHAETVRLIERGFKVLR